MTIRHFFTMLIGALVFMVAVSASANEGVLFIGDSLADGLKHPIGKYFRSKGVPFTAVTKESQCIDSFTKGAMSGQFRAELSKRPEVVIVSLGTNDMYAPSRKHAEYAQAQLMKLHEMIQSVGASMFTIGPPNMPEKNTLGVTKNTQIYRILMTVSPRFFESRDIELPRQSDGIHPLKYQPWADQIIPWLQRG